MIQKTGSSRTGRILLLIGGVFQALFALLHVSMFFGISRDPALSAAIKPLLHIFNAAVLATVLFFAYASFFRRRELIQTSFGRAACLFIGVFYLQRGVVDAVVNGVNPVPLGLLLLVAAFYFVAPFAPQSAGSPVNETAALDGVSSN